MQVSAFPGALLRTRRLRLAAAFGCVALAAGCGFHLQGDDPLPPGVDHIAVTYHDDYTVGDPELVTALRQRLRRQHLLGDAGAPAELHIVSVDDSQQTAAVSPVDGDTVVYDLSVRVVFDYSVHGNARLTGQTLTISHDYTTDATQQLSSDDERDHLLDQMQDDLANRVLERIAMVDAQSKSKTDSGGQ